MNLVIANLTQVNKIVLNLVSFNLDNNLKIQIMKIVDINIHSPVLNLKLLLSLLNPNNHFHYRHNNHNLHHQIIMIYK